MKKKSKSGDNVHRQKVERLKSLESKLEVIINKMIEYYQFYISLFQSKSRAEKSELDQKILEVIQKRSALKSQVYSPEMSSLDCNNNQELLRRAALVQELTQTCSTSQPSPFSAAGSNHSLVLILLSLHHLTFSSLQRPRPQFPCRTASSPPTGRRRPS